MRKIVSRLTVILVATVALGLSPLPALAVPLPPESGENSVTLVSNEPGLMFHFGNEAAIKQQLATINFGVPVRLLLALTGAPLQDKVTPADTWKQDKANQHYLTKERNLPVNTVLLVVNTNPRADGALIIGAQTNAMMPAGHEAEAAKLVSGETAFNRTLGELTTVLTDNVIDPFVVELATKLAHNLNPKGVRVSVSAQQLKDLEQAEAQAEANWFAGLFQAIFGSALKGALVGAGLALVGGGFGLWLKKRRAKK